MYKINKIENGFVVDFSDLRMSRYFSDLMLVLRFIESDYEAYEKEMKKYTITATTGSN